MRRRPPKGETHAQHYPPSPCSPCHTRARIPAPGERLRYTDKFDDPSLPGEMQTTVALKEVSFGTELNVVQEGVPDAIPADACYLGWQQSLALLAQLVEADIPDE